jgi:hypothetical protein
LLHHNLQVKSKEFYEDLHDIYDLVALGDEDVIKDKPHFPEEECAVVASDDEFSGDLPVLASLSDEDVVEDKPLAP